VEVEERAQSNSNASRPATWCATTRRTSIGYLGYTHAVAKVLVSFDDSLLRRIDRTARSRGLTRSAYLAQLAENDARMAGPGRDRAAQAALRELDLLFAAAPGGDSTAAIRTARDAR